MASPSPSGSAGSSGAPRLSPRKTRSGAFLPKRRATRKARSGSPAASGSPAVSDALFVWATQLVVNFLWTIFYFRFRALLLSFFWLLFLLALVWLMVVRFRRIDRRAGNLQIPYLIWLGFAGYLNFATWLLNR